MRIALAWLLIPWLASCGEPGARTPSCHGVVSLSPAITQTLVALGVGSELVGRTPWCPGDAPVVGSLLDLDAEAMTAARPCVILVQPPAQGMDPTVVSLAARLGAAVHAWPLATLGDVRVLLEQLPAAAAPGDAAAQARAAELRQALDAACAPLDWPAKQTVLVVQSGEGRLACGPDTYIGEFLAACGVPNALKRGAWQTLTLEDIVALRPTVLITIGAAPTNWATDACARSGARWVAINDDALLVPSGTLGEGLARMRSALVQKRAEP